MIHTVRQLTRAWHPWVITSDRFFIYRFLRYRDRVTNEKWYVPDLGLPLRPRASRRAFRTRHDAVEYMEQFHARRKEGAKKLVRDRADLA